MAIDWSKYPDLAKAINELHHPEECQQFVHLLADVRREERARFLGALGGLRCRNPVGFNEVDCGCCIECKRRVAIEALGDDDE